MKRKFVKHPSSITASSAVRTLEVDEQKLYEVAYRLYEDSDDNPEYGGRHDDIDWTIYDGPEDIDVECILYVVYGLEDGEDYQLMNGRSIMITDTANGIWKQVERDLC